MSYLLHVNHGLHILDLQESAGSSGWTQVVLVTVDDAGNFLKNEWLGSNVLSWVRFADNIKVEQEIEN